MGELVPSYPQPYRLFNPLSGHPLFSGPQGQPGYGSPQVQSDSWTMPDGTPVWFYDTSTPDPTNRVALGLDVIWPGAPSIGYQGMYDAAVRHGANPDQADLFAAIGMAESSGHWGDHNNNSATGDDSIGLWQINLRAHPQYRATNLYNIDANAQAASEVSGGWSNPRPWSTYLSGAYKTYLKGGGAPIGGVQGPPTPPPAQAGIFRRAVDALIGHIPDVPLIGGAIRGGVRDVLEPIADLLDSWIDILAHDIEGAINLARSLAKGAEDLAATLVRDAEHAAEQGLHDLASFTGGLIVGAEHLAESLVGDAERLAETGLHDLASFTGGLIRDAEHLAEAGIRDAEHLADTAVHDLAAVTEGLIRDAEHLAAAGIGEAEHLAEVGLHDLEHVAETLVHDGIDVAETVARDLVHAAVSELHVLEHDVIDPLEREAAHWFHDLLGGIEHVIPALETLGDWIVAAAQVAILGPLDVAETVGGISQDEVIAAVRRTAQL